MQLPGDSIICGACILKLRHVHAIGKPGARTPIENAQLPPASSAVYPVRRESTGGDLDKRRTGV
jgi:hypothetical protein